MKINLTKEEIRVLDNELFVLQYKLSRLNLFENVDSLAITKEEKEYKKIVDGLRVKLGKHLERAAIKKHVSAVNE
tara:strand:- start:552 stop:776 length:225 start_codon:yes stop_codon:yes gene_type:complete